MKISPLIDLLFKLGILALTLIGAAFKLGHPSIVSDTLASDIVWWTSLILLPFFSGAYAVLGTGSVPSLTAAGKVMSFVAVCLLLTLMLATPPAMAKPRRPVPAPPARPTAITLQTPDQLIDKVRLWATTDGGADLDAAIAVGKTANNPVTVPCFQAIRGFVSTVQSLPTADKLPKLHLAVDIEILTDLEIQLLPNSPVIVSCTALANFQAVSAQNLVTGIVSGALALSKFAPVIPPI